MKVCKENERDDYEVVINFLRKISVAAKKLSQEHNEHDGLMYDSSDEDADYFVDQIARHLLSACNPSILCLDVSNLPKLNAAGNEEKHLLEEETDNEDIAHYQYRKTDYLRLLLRVIASISMNVAANVCSLVLSSQKSIRSMNHNAFLLFSHWLPVAPHLTPMVTELFKNIEDPTRDMDKANQHIRFLMSEACFNLSSFYSKRRETATIRKIWNWVFVFDLLRPEDTDTEMSTSEMMKTSLSSSIPIAIRWYSAHTLACLLDWKTSVVDSVLEKMNLDQSRGPWLIHPWAVDQEANDIQSSQFRGYVRLWNSEEFPIPSAEQTHHFFSETKFLATVGPGLTFYRHSTINGMSANADIGAETNVAGDDITEPKNHLIPTPTTCRNLSLLGASLCQQHNAAPILICGPRGSGKSSLVREIMRLCRPGDSLLEFHIDEETDSKTLIGSYTITDIPGEFAWRAGALTHATREGRWVLLEDVDSVPAEIQATLVKLLEDRMLPLGNGKYESCHPNFRIFGTCTTSLSQQQKRHSLRITANRGGGKHILNPSLWRKVHVNSLPFSELKEIAVSLYSTIPETVIDSAVSLMQALDRSARRERSDLELMDGDIQRDALTTKIRTTSLWTGSREPAVRDFLKLLSRISNGINFEKNVDYATEAQRTLCLAESVDIFVGSFPERERKRKFITLIAAPVWSISRDLALSYVEARRPSTLSSVEFIEIGRAKIHIGFHNKCALGSSNTFAPTNHALRLMESVGVCIRENEPILLVGETGCGKTSLIQQLAAKCERELIVQNLSLQTDSTDLLGGYRPLELKNVARRIYQDFVDLFVSTFSRKQNAKFLQYASSTLEKSNWKMLSQCFQKAARLGLEKVKEEKEKATSSMSRKSVASLALWSRFAASADRFERQRLSCNAGLAFVFSEGALVDAIQSGKWYVFVGKISSIYGCHFLIFYLPCKKQGFARRN